jgi:hypothetical protein
MFLSGDDFPEFRLPRPWPTFPERWLLREIDLRFSVTIYDTVTAVRPQSYLSLIRLIPKCYSNLSLGFKGAPKKEFPIATAPKPTMAEVLQLCSYPVVVSPDAPPGVFGLLSIQMASIRPEVVLMAVGWYLRFWLSVASSRLRDHVSQG